MPYIGARLDSIGFLGLASWFSHYMWPLLTI